MALVVFFIFFFVLFFTLFLLWKCASAIASLFCGYFNLLQLSRVLELKCQKSDCSLFLFFSSARIVFPFFQSLEDFKSFIETSPILTGKLPSIYLCKQPWFIENDHSQKIQLLRVFFIFLFQTFLPRAKWGNFAESSWRHRRKISRFQGWFFTRIWLTAFHSQKELQVGLKLKKKYDSCWLFIIVG